ncbi:MAG: DUF4388 domain-containing protein [Nitrospirae bacterium]|nr:DUF4388 domain-containing protein [Nitrospirota bacterium]
MSVKGRLKDMSLADLIQIFGAERKTVAIHLGSEKGYGHVYLKDGRLAHVAYRDLVGADALYPLLAWEDGEFQVEPGATLPEHTVLEPAEVLILEGFRRLDESKVHAGDPREYVGDLESLSLIEKLLELGILERRDTTQIP